VAGSAVPGTTGVQLSDAGGWTGWHALGFAADARARHDVSIRMAPGRGGGRWRGVSPRLNLSMMRMRAPQQEHGGISASGS
jgi:hypothetical protein